ncbi:MAG: putative LysR-family transcriptional regulator [Amycolatopsis sp.]|jgi:DNA-binding transcriptional LysR family regulator|nr:putative LysR-family transcriptional regulator [Amycolatopsis sp.]
MLHLRYFVAVAEELNFSQAARKLHMAASPLSQRIKDLEHELGEQLFQRSTHRVELTPAGEALLPLARDVLDRVNAIPWKVREATPKRRSTLFIGMPAAVHPELRERVRVLEESCRDSFELKRWPGTSAGLVNAVNDGRLALTLARLPVTDPALDVLEVMSEKLGAVVPADRFAGRTSIGVGELADLSYVSSPADATPAYFEQIDVRLAAAGVKRRLRVNTTGYEGVTELISGGIAFTVSMLDPKSPMQHYRLENVSVLPFDDFDPELVTGLLWRKDRAEPGGDLEKLIEQTRNIFNKPLHS